MAIRTRTITSYEEITEVIDRLNEYKFLVANEELAEYRSMSWGFIYDNFISDKAFAYNDPEHPLLTDTLGLAKVNEQGIVTGVKELEASDIPDIAMNQVFGLIAELAGKVDKEFALATNHYVVGYIKAEVHDKERTESGRIIEVEPYLNIDKTYVSPLNDEDHPAISTQTKIKSKDGSIKYTTNEKGDILLYVDGSVTNVQADWEENDESAGSYIRNKPHFADVAYTGEYNDLHNKVGFKSVDEETLLINYDATQNKYLFNVISKAEWGHIVGDLNGQTDLMEKFSKYYTAFQIDELLAEISRGLLKVKGYVSRFDPSLSGELRKGTFWLKTFSTGAPEGKTFACYMLTNDVESGGTANWVETVYSANDFDVWININTADSNDYFWLGSRWEQLDFTFDLSNYYTKTQVDTKLSEKQDKLTGTAGEVLTYGENLGEIVGTELATVATTGSYNDLSDTPEVVNADWNQTDYTQPDYIKNKPLLADVATSGDYNDLINKPAPVAPQEQADWQETDATKPSFIKNKPDIKDTITSISQLFLTFTDYNVNDHSYNINLADIPETPFFTEVSWNGVEIRADYEYIITVDGIYYTSQELVPNLELDSLFISTRRYSTFYPIAERAIQTDWEIGAKLSDSEDDVNVLSIISNTVSKTIKVYENGELISSLSTDDTLPDFYQNMVYTGSETYTIREVVGTPESNIIGMITTGKMILLGDSYPEATDTGDIFTLKFYINS